MAIMQLTLDARINGYSALGFPLQFLFTLDELQQFDYDEPDDGNDTTFSALPVTQIDTVEALLVQAIDNAIGIRLEGGEVGNAALRLSARGGILVWGATLTGTNLTVNNNTGVTARVAGFGGGT